jgi:hypothetical protein
MDAPLPTASAQLSVKLTVLSLKLTFLSLKLTFLSLKLTFLSLKADISQMVALRRLPLKERVVQLLSHCVVLRFDRLTALSGATPEQEEDLIKATTANATLVQGCWVSSRIDLVAFRVSSTQVEDAPPPASNNPISTLEYPYSACDHMLRA